MSFELSPDPQSAYRDLLPHLGTAKKIRVTRSFWKEELMNGYLMGLSEELGVIHCFDDFEPDGYTIFRLRDVVEIRSSAFERHWDRMLLGEGLLSGLEVNLSVDLTDIKSAVHSIDSNHQFMIVEVENNDAPDGWDSYSIGQVAAFSDDELIFDDFDGRGRWDDVPSYLLWKSISLIHFKTPYINTFRKYLTGTPSAEQDRSSQHGEQ